MVPKQPGRTYAADKTMQSVAWINRYSSLYGDKMPDHETIQLPSSMCKGDVYDLMSEDIRDIGDVVISKSHFYKSWKVHFPNVGIPKVWWHSFVDFNAKAKTFTFTLKVKCDIVSIYICTAL